MKVVYSRAARADLDNIWLYVARDSPSAADRLIDQLVDTAKPLEAFPLMGVARPELAADLRALRMGYYIIFYRPRGRDVRVERVLHARMDITPDYF